MTFGGTNQVVDMRSVSPEQGALLDVTQRLARQIEQQLAQLERLRGGRESDVGLGDLEHLARRMRRESERLRMLCGADPAGFSGSIPPRSIGEVLADATAATTESIRITVRPAPIATIEPRAAAELGHVLAEVLDAALAVSALGVTMGGRLGPAGLTVDVTVDGPRRDAGPGVMGVADALARRSGRGIQVHRAGADGPYAIVLCPAAALAVSVQRRPEPMQDRSSIDRDMFGVRSNGSAGGAALFGTAGADPLSAPFPPAADPLSAPAAGGLFAPPRAAAPSVAPLPPAGPPPPRSSGADPLFGPLPSRGPEPIETPIYAAVVSAWFSEDDTRAADWESPGDLEWRAAAARAAQAEEPGGRTTASGLPRRRPGRQMVTPPLQGRRAAAATVERDAPTSEDRQPDRVRSRLDDYQRGLQQGRHRAAEPEPEVRRPTRWAGSA